MRTESEVDVNSLPTEVLVGEVISSYRSVKSNGIILSMTLVSDEDRALAGVEYRNQKKYLRQIMEVLPTRPDFDGAIEKYVGSQEGKIEKEVADRMETVSSEDNARLATELEERKRDDLRKDFKKALEFRTIT